MGVSKSEFFTEQQNQLATLFKAMSHPARIAIIQYLLQVDTCICGDIVNELPLAQPTVSQHLKGTIEGTAICYCLNPDTLKMIEEYFEGLTNQLQNKCC